MYIAPHALAAASALTAPRLAFHSTFMKGYHRAAVALEQIGTADALKQAVGLCEKGLHHYPGNGDLVGLLAGVRTRYDAMEAERKAGLVGADALKEQGNELFKSAQFEKAIEVYTRAYNACEDKTSETALKVLNNRAACNQQLSNFSAVMEDTTQVLEIEPNNMKAIIRRCLALEGMEKYRAALSDCRRGLLIDASNPILNQAQQRLGRSVRTLKKASAHM